MSAENPEQGDGGDLRARYLPVSRKELRRRREAELAAQQADGRPSGTQDGGSVDTPSDEDSQPTPPAGPVSAAVVLDEQTQTASTPVVSPHDQADAAVLDADDDEAVAGSEDAAGEDGAADDSQGVEDVAAEVTDVTLPAVREEDAAQDLADSEDLVDSEGLVDVDAAETGTLEVVPVPPSEDGDQAEASDADDLDDDDLDDDDGDDDGDDFDGDDLEDADDVGLGAGDPGGETADAGLPEDEADDADDVDDDADDADDDEADGGEASEDSPEETAPVPASRKARRLLRETGSLQALTDDKLQEIDQLTAAIATQSAQDPHRVDPELLKKQQALAAKAMQANQERRRREIEEEERDRRRRRRERPESEVITRKALRAYATSDDQEYVDVPTGEIDPIEASGAHGLELDDMVEQTTRQASRQALLLWLVIILAALLLIAVGVVLFTVL
ncbi:MULTISPECIES: hypothetical protein [Actinomycetes]|uniref:Uncharacterized protein n=2 Tax=Actinomycetes TaxID=1760 RepID=A0ABP6LSC9_9MICC